MKTYLIALIYAGILGLSSCATCPDDRIRLVGKSESHKETVYGVRGSFGGGIGRKGSSVALVTSNPEDACSAVQGVMGSVAISTRGGCSFLDKALAVQAGGGLGLVVHNNASMDGEGTICMTGDEDDKRLKSVLIPVVAVTWGDGILLREVASERGSITMKSSIRHPLLSSVLLWVIAVGLVFVGSIWSGQDYLNNRRSRNQRSLLSGRSDDDSSTSSLENQAVVVNEKSAVLFVVWASILLVVLALVLNKVIYFILLAVFVLAAIQGLSALLAYLISRAAPWTGTKIVKLGVLGDIPCSYVVATPLATAACITWAIFRNAPYSWIPQDVIGAALLLLVLRVIRIPSLKIATILLSSFLIYDVFWVFIQPLFTPDKKSVMVEVATAKGMDEFMPMVFRVPSIWDSGLGDYSILGYGDVAMPGFLVAYTRRLDLCRSKRPLQGYFLYSMIGYGVGLLATCCAQMLRIGGGRGQPALLYLVPCTLGTVLILSLMRSELLLLMKHKQREQDSDSGSSNDDDDDSGDEHVQDP